MGERAAEQVARELAEDSRGLRRHFSREGVLLPIRRLAGRFHVTAYAVRQALRRLSEAGYIEQVGRGERFRATPIQAHESDVMTSPRCEQVRCGIREGIMRGLYRIDHNLPPSAALCREYACSPRTLSRALHALCEEGALKRYSHGFRPVAPPGMRPGSRIVITGGENAFHSRHGASLLFVKSLEQVVDEFGWNRPEIILSDHPAQAPLPPAHDIAAFVYVGGYAQGWIDRYSEHRAIPLFMLNPADVLDARTAARIRGTQLCTDNVSAGLKVATLLARYEHRHIAYLENLQAPEMKSWGAPRRDGLAMVFGKAGRSMQSVHIEKSRHKPENVSRMQVKSLAAHINRELKRDAALPPFLRLDALSELWPLIDIIDQRDAYGESFSRLLEDTRISCWVCANDNLAAAAALFLRKHNQRRRVSLVSFDNSTLAYRLRLASYDFRFDLSARAMLWLLAKKAVTPRDQRGIATVTFSHGQLIVRDSLTRAARRTA